MKGLRTSKNQEKYTKYLKKNKEEGCPLCKRLPLKAFKYWKVIKNNFPYDKIAREHNMIVPLRHVTEDFLNRNELRELKDIKNVYIKEFNYHYILEATAQIKTQPEHFHLHIIKLRL